MRNLSLVTSYLALSTAKNITAPQGIAVQYPTDIRFGNIADGAFSCTISENLRALMGNISHCSEGSADKETMLGTAESAIQETLDLLQSMKAKAVQAASGIWADVEYEAMDEDYQKSLAEIDTIANETTYNGIPLLDGTWAKNPLKDDSIDDDNGRYACYIPDLRVRALGLEGTSLKSQETAYALLHNDDEEASEGLDNEGHSAGKLDAAIKAVRKELRRLDIYQTCQYFRKKDSAKTKREVAHAESVIRDAATAKKMTEQAKRSLYEKASEAMLAHSCYNTANVLDLLA